VALGWIQSLSAFSGTFFPLLLVWLCLFNFSLSHRLKLINGTDAFILESVFSGTVFATLSQPFSKTNEIAVMQYILNFATENKERLLQSQSKDAARTPSLNLHTIATLRQQVSVSC
jgi:hypothetical protein